MIVEMFRSFYAGIADVKVYLTVGFGAVIWLTLWLIFQFPFSQNLLGGVVQRFVALAKVGVVVIILFSAYRICRQLMRTTRSSRQERSD